MPDNAQQPGDGGAPRDPWAPPDHGVDLRKPAEARPPALHDQPTVAAMPGTEAGPGPVSAPPAGAFGPQQPGVPAPPTAPAGPGQPDPYGYPAAPAAATPSYGYPGHPAFGTPQSWGPAPANGLGTAAMVLGIIAVAGFCMWGLGIILGILALIFGIIGRGRAKRGEATNGGMALTGIILGSVSIVISAVFLAFLVWAIANGDSGDDFDYDDPYATSLVVGSGR